MCAPSVAPSLPIPPNFLNTKPITAPIPSAIRKYSIGQVFCTWSDHSRQGTLAQSPVVGEFSQNRKESALWPDFEMAHSSDVSIQAHRLMVEDLIYGHRSPPSPLPALQIEFQPPIGIRRPELLHAKNFPPPIPIASPTSFNPPHTQIMFPPSPCIPQTPRQYSHLT